MWQHSASTSCWGVGMNASTLVRRLRPRSGYDLVAVVALMLALGGGTAMAAVIVSSNSQIAANTVSGSKRPAGFANDNVANGSIDTPDLSANARPHRLEFDRSGTSPGTEYPIATVGNVALSGTCAAPVGSTPYLLLFAKNITTQLGTINNLVVSESSVSNSPAVAHTSGHYIGAGAKYTVDASESTDPAGLVLPGTANSRVEGQVVFQTPGRVTTIQFHASNIGGRCSLAGTAVTATQP